MVRRLVVLVALVGMVVVPPALLLRLGFYDWRGLSLWTAADVRIVLLVLTVVGWLVWAIWMVCLLTELVAMVGSGRRTLRLPGLSAPQALAGWMLAALLASGVSTIAASALPIAATPSLVSGDLAAPTVARATALHHEAPRTASPAGAAVKGHAVRHVVTTGDDLWTLAGRYYGEGTKWRAIVAANPELQDDPLAELPVGQGLRIVDPVRLVTVQHGDTLSGLARQYLADPHRWPEIRALNRARIADPDVIKAGWVLRVPLTADALAQQDPSEDLVPAAAASPAPAEVPAQREASEQRASEREASEREASEREASEQETAAQQAAGGADRLVDFGIDLARVTAAVGGLTALTASAVLAGLAIRRRIQRASRPMGRRYAQPDDDLVRAEVALAFRAEAGPADRVADREDLVGRAMRHLSRAWCEAGIAAPALERVVVGEADVEFVLAEDPAVVPDGFQLLGRGVAASWVRLAALDDPPYPVAYPALVTLGEDASLDLVLVDLLTAGTLGVAGDADAVASALSGMLVELTCAPWADELGILVVTDDPAFARAAAPETVATTSSIDEGVAHLERVAAERGRFLTTPDAYRRSRLEPNLAEAWCPHVVLFEKTPDPEQVARLEAAASAQCGAIAVLPVRTSGVTWQLRSDAGGEREVVGTLVADVDATLPRQELAAQTIPHPTREAIAGLFAAAQSTASDPAPWWHHAGPTDPEVSDTMFITALRPMPADRGPYLRLLGPVDLQNAAGVAPPKAARQCLEYAAWLLQHPGATATEMTSALLVAETTRRSNMSRLRSWLGADAASGLYLPDAYSGRIALHPDVTSDWDRLQQLMLGGVNRASTERLTAALELVRGAPLADAAPGQWNWAEELRTDMAAMVRDVGVVLASRARSERNLELARWAANRALAAAPDDELLVGERIRTEYAAGALDEVDRLAQRVHRTARVLGIDLLPETVDLLQEVMEGHLRVRRA